MEVNIVKKNNCHTKAIVNKFSNAKIYLNNFIIPRSSSGRTKDSGSFNDGSNPSLGVFCFLIFHIHIFQKDFHFLPFSWRGIANYNVILSKAKYLLLGESLRFFGEICNLFYYPNCKSPRMT